MLIRYYAFFARRLVPFWDQVGTFLILSCEFALLPANLVPGGGYLFDAERMPNQFEIISEEYFNE